MSAEMKNVVYILHCADGTLYTGWTNDLKRRLFLHNEGKGAKYTKPRRPVQVVYTESYAEKNEAMKREYAIKKLSREEKLRLIEEGARISGSRFTMVPGTKEKEREI